MLRVLTIKLSLIILSWKALQRNNQLNLIYFELKMFKKLSCFDFQKKLIISSRTDCKATKGELNKVRKSWADD